MKNLLDVVWIHLRPNHRIIAAILTLVDLVVAIAGMFGAIKYGNKLNEQCEPHHCIGMYDQVLEQNNAKVFNNYYSQHVPVGAFCSMTTLYVLSCIAFLLATLHLVAPLMLPMLVFKATILVLYPFPMLYGFIQPQKYWYLTVGSVALFIVWYFSTWLAWKIYQTVEETRPTVIPTAQQTPAPVISMNAAVSWETFED